MKLAEKKETEFLIHIKANFIHFFLVNMISFKEYDFFKVHTIKSRHPNATIANDKNYIFCARAYNGGVRDHKAPLSTFNEDKCHSESWKINSLKVYSIYFDKSNITIMQLLKYNMIKAITIFFPCI